MGSCLHLDNSICSPGKGYTLVHLLTAYHSSLYTDPLVFRFTNISLVRLNRQKQGGLLNQLNRYEHTLYSINKQHNNLPLIQLVRNNNKIS